MTRMFYLYQVLIFSQMTKMFYLSQVLIFSQITKMFYLCVSGVDLQSDDQDAGPVGRLLCSAWVRPLPPGWSHEHQWPERQRAWNDLSSVSSLTSFMKPFFVLKTFSSVPLPWYTTACVVCACTCACVCVRLCCMHWILTTRTFKDRERLGPVGLGAASGHYYYCIFPEKKNDKCRWAQFGYCH